MQYHTLPSNTILIQCSAHGATSILDGVFSFYCWNQTLYNVHDRWKRPWICCHGGIGWPFILLKGTCQVNHARAPEKNTGDSSSMSDASKYDKTKWKKGSSVQELHRQAGFLGSEVPSYHRWHSALSYLNYLIIQLTALAGTRYIAPNKDLDYFQLHAIWYQHQTTFYQGWRGMAFSLPIARPYSHLIISQTTGGRELLLVRQLKSRSFSSLAEGFRISSC